MAAKVENKEQIVQGMRSSKERLSELGVESIGLFGSFANGNPTPGSDVDVFVVFAPAHHTFDNFMELSFLLEELFGRKVELVTPESLSPHIGPRILEEVELVPFAA